MSKPSRPQRSPAEGSQTTRTFFVSSSTWGRRNLFHSERMARLFLELLMTYRDQGRYLLHDFVVMPDHFHALMSVPPRMTIERAVQLVKGGFSYRAKKELGFHGEIWQRGFSDEYIATLRDLKPAVLISGKTLSGQGWCGFRKIIPMQQQAREFMSTGHRNISGAKALKAG